MYFFDCHVCYGIVGNRTQYMPVTNVEKVLEDMDAAGIKKAILYRNEQLFGVEPALGNKMISEDVIKSDRLFGLWSIVPSDTCEIASPDKIPAEMKNNRIIGWKISPSCHRFSKRPYILEDYFELACKNKIPVFINTAHGYTLDETADILEKFPTLTIVLTYDNIWPNDRNLRPFVRKYSNVYLDLSQFITAGGLEDFVDRLGSARLLYGSGYAEAYQGAGMLMVLKAKIKQSDIENIAFGNMERILEGIIYDK